MRAPIDAGRKNSLQPGVAKERKVAQLKPEEHLALDALRLSEVNLQSEFCKWKDAKK
jgi:hypothetical protein